MSTKTLTNSRAAAFAAQRGRCCYCGNPMWLAESESFVVRYGLSTRQARQLRCTAEHLQAQSEGGANSRENIAAACAYCNHKRHQAKNPLAPDDYREYVRRRLRKGGWHQLCLPSG